MASRLCHVNDFVATERPGSGKAYQSKIEKTGAKVQQQRSSSAAAAAGNKTHSSVKASKSATAAPVISSAHTKTPGKTAAPLTESSPSSPSSAAQRLADAGKIAQQQRTIDDLQRNIHNLHEELRAARGKGTAGVDSRARSHFQELSAKMSKMEQFATEHLAQQHKDMEELHAKLATSEKARQLLENKKAGVIDDLLKEKEAYKRKLQTAAENSSAKDVKLAQLADMLTSMDASNSAKDAQLTELQAKLKSLNANSSAKDTKLAELQAKLKAAAENTSAKDAKITELASKLKTAVESNSAKDAKMAELQSKFDTANKANVVLVKNLNGYHARLAEVQSKLQTPDQVAKQIAARDAKISELQSKLQASENDLDQAFDMADRAHNIITAAIALENTRGNHTVANAMLESSAAISKWLSG